MTSTKNYLNLAPTCRGTFLTRFTELTGLNKYWTLTTRSFPSLESQSTLRRALNQM